MSPAPLARGPTTPPLPILARSSTCRATLPLRRTVGTRPPLPQSLDRSHSRARRTAAQCSTSAGSDRTLELSPLKRAYSLSDLGSSCQDNDNLVLETDRLAAADIELMDPRMGNGMILTRGRWCWEVREKTHYRLRGLVHFHNTTEKNEIFVPELEASAKLLAPKGLSVRILQTPTGNYSWNRLN